MSTNPEVKDSMSWRELDNVIIFTVLMSAIHLY